MVKDNLQLGALNFNLEAWLNTLVCALEANMQRFIRTDGRNIQLKIFHGLLSYGSVSTLFQSTRDSSPVFGRQGIWSPRYLGAEVFGRRGIWTPRYSDAEVFGRQGIWTPRYLDAEVSGPQHIRVLGFTRAQ
ncbi:hypothetical protein CALVIDRAFT_532142, partial [Calocera viscosa TUFC12733]